jgi:hypothetical protein
VARRVDIGAMPLPIGQRPLDANRDMVEANRKLGRSRGTTPANTDGVSPNGSISSISTPPTRASPIRSCGSPGWATALVSNL